MTIDLNQKYTFETFVEGAPNRLALKATRTVAEVPGSSYNPLLIYGPSGLGKTHLLMAVGNLVRDQSPEAAVEYLLVEEFFEAHHAAEAAGQVEAFRSRFNDVDLMLLDDIQFVSHQPDMQDEVAHLISVFQTPEKQLVIASDRPPFELEELQEDVLTLIVGGLVVDIGPPDFQVRREILAQRAEERSADLADGVIDAMAAIETDNVRDLLGMLHKLVAFQAVSDQPLTEESARALLAGEEVAEPHVQAAVRDAPATTDEFAAFIEDVEDNVVQHLKSGSARTREAIERWQALGVETRRLEQLLETGGDLPKGLARFESDAERLRELQIEVEGLDPEEARTALFRDPDRLEEAAARVREFRRAQEAPLPAPAPGRTLDRVLESHSNSAAVEAVRQLVEGDLSWEHPLVLVGGPGCGKSFLLHAAANQLIKQGVSQTACLSAQRYVEGLVQAMSEQRIDSWRAWFENAAGFFLDDVHLIAGKERSQQELLRLLRSLSGRGRPVACTLNQAPSLIEGLDAQLVSRLEAGTAVAIGVPDRGLRAGLVQEFLEEHFGSADQDLVDYLADRPVDSIRGLQALLKRVKEAAQESGTTPTPAWALQLLGGTMGRQRRLTMRTSGIAVSPLESVLSVEKTVWRWPDISQMLIEELD